MRNFIKSLIFFVGIFIFFIPFKSKSQVNLQWPCGQYVTRQEAVSGNTAPFKSVINVLNTQTNGSVGLDKVCENTTNLFNASKQLQQYKYLNK